MSVIKPGSPEARVLISGYKHYLDTGIRKFKVKDFMQALNPPLDDKEIQRALRYLEIAGEIECTPNYGPVAESFKIMAPGLLWAQYREDQGELK